MKTGDLLGIYSGDERIAIIAERLTTLGAYRIGLKGLCGSSRAFIAASVFEKAPIIHLFVLPDKESAAYFCNDLENIFDEAGESTLRKKVLFYPASYKRQYEPEKIDNTNVMLRTEVLGRIQSVGKNTMVVTYPEALSEKVITTSFLVKNRLKLKSGEAVSVDFVMELLAEYDFERVDFVVEPGQYAIRGGIVDVYSYANDLPYRVEFSGDMVESIRTFDPADQLSIEKLSHITIIPNLQDRLKRETKQSFLSFLPAESAVWIDDITFTADLIDKEFLQAEEAFISREAFGKHQDVSELFIDGNLFKKELLDTNIIEFGNRFHFKNSEAFLFDHQPQPSFNKNFDILFQNLEENNENGLKNILLASTPKQVERIHTILEDISINRGKKEMLDVSLVQLPLHEGYVDRDMGIACYTDHQIFERHHRYRIRDNSRSRETLTLKEVYNLNPGDYVTHIDHGIGRFAGLEKIENNGKQQEAIRLLYKEGDLLYVSIHSLHRISKYVGKEGTPPTLNRLGSNTWANLKNKTKKRVKDIAKDLIKLYAKRRTSEGFAFSADNYMQHELEASFIYEDTPDQVKSTADVKNDMEASCPMDRLICGDVGFGKTEVAIRAAFKAVADSKQVAVLVPTTILALQHYKTFSDRLAEFPCKVNYINRFKSTKQQKEALAELESGKLDVIIGTHRLISKDVKFKDLGLLIIDEEQKFGVSAKEKLKQIKVNVDTLTLTATPIPRTLQFSLMGARDLSVINTAPPNRYPIQTELHPFNEEVIRDAIEYEVSRGGQVFLVHNRIQNIEEVAGLVQRLCPDVRIAVGHGRLEGHKLEQIMMDFIDGEYDVLVATAIIESGLDIPNANTIIINEAQNFGMSDLHQLRGRVGRANKKAFCYLLAPPLSVLTDEARKRLKAIEEFSDLGSGFNIAMRDLDIRGAGNLLGAEQSGFITEIGYEMYQKILDEAIHELKETEFSSLFREEHPQEFVRDCVIETDLEILIPDDYISNITERLSLYKELDNVETGLGLEAFQERLIDRFGPIPQQTQQLINTIRLRWLAKGLGFEKIILKQGVMIGHFVSNPESLYYQSAVFGEILKFVKENPALCRMKESTTRLTLTFKHTNTVQKALTVLGEIAEKS